MKKILLPLLLLSAISLTAQVPNNSFENWTTGNPDDWFTNNVPGLAVTVTQVTPAQAGSSAARGEVVSFSGSALAPLLASTDASLNGFPVTQAYANFSFWYKLSTSGSTAMVVSLVMYDNTGGFAGGAGNIISGTVNTFTLVNLPIYYSGSNPVECVITFLLTDTVSGNPDVGNFFIIDNLTLSGTTSLNEPVSQNNAAIHVTPNPAAEHATISIADAINETATLLLYDIKGSIVKHISTEMTEPGPYEWLLPISDLSEGIYHARIACEDKQWNTRIIKN